MMDETPARDRIETLPAPSAGRETAQVREILHVDRLCVTLNEGAKAILSGITFSLRETEIFGIAGASGSGKSTLGGAMMKLLPPATHAIGGRVLYGGINVLEAGDEERRRILRSGIRYLFQEPGQALNPIARVGTQLRYSFDDGGGAEEHFHALLDSFGLREHAALMRAYPHELSVGTLQRILMAAALAPGPQVLIADEPTSAIDFVLKHQMMERLQELCAAHRMAVIFITHDLPLARRYAGRLSVLSDGRLVQEQ